MKSGQSSPLRLKSALANLHFSKFPHIILWRPFLLWSLGNTLCGTANRGWRALREVQACRWERGGGRERLPCFVALFMWALFAEKESSICSPREQMIIRYPMVLYQRRVNLKTFCVCVCAGVQGFAFSKSKCWGGGVISKYKRAERSTQTMGIFNKWGKKINNSHCLTKTLHLRSVFWY